MSFKVQKIKDKVKETEAKAYTPKKVKVYETVKEAVTTTYNEDKNIKTADNSIQGILNACDSSIKDIMDSKKAYHYIAKAGSLWIIFKDKTKLKVEYLNQPKVKVGKDKVQYTLMDSHNKVLA